MATPPLPAGYKLVDDTPPLPAGYKLQGPIDPTARPAGAAGPLPAIPRAPLPSDWDRTGSSATIGSSPGDIARTVGSHALQAARGPLQAIAAPPQGTAEKVIQAAGPAALPLYRTLVKPSLAPAAQTLRQAGQGQYADAARSAESAIPIVGPWADQVESDVGQHGAVAGLAGLATDVLAPAAAARVAGAIPAAATDSAAGMWNRAVGSRKADFARGANPGRGAVDAGIGPSGSMESIADKAGDARQEVGHALGNAYDTATASGKLIPADTVRQAIHPVIDAAKGKAELPGVMADPAVYDDLKNSFEPALQAADAKGGFTPNELWKIRKDINDSLNWGDQSRLNMTRTQQRVSGALGGVLEDAVPDAAELNQNYQDLLKLENRAQERANTHSSPLTSIAGKVAATGAGALLGAATHNPVGSAAGALLGGALDSLPAKTTVASGLGAAGKVLKPAVPIARGSALPATLAAVTGNDQPTNVGNAHDQGDNGTPNKEVDNVVQASPSEQSITLEHSPDTHTFSTKAWLTGNPDGDPNEAKAAAQTLGYEITD